MDDLALLADNPRQHDDRNLGHIAGSIQAVGAARSGVIDEGNVILAGNGMRQGAARAGLTEAIIVETDGSRPVFVRRRGLSPEQKARLVVDDNRATELSTWGPTLAQYAEQAPAVKDGWTPQEWRKAVSVAEPKAGRTDPDAVPDVKPTTSVQRGDLFRLGAHLLLCGDSTNVDDVQLVCNGVRPVLMNTDPPYGIAYTDEARVAAERAHGRPLRKEKWSQGIENDGGENLDGAKLQAFLESAIRAAVPVLAERCAFYLWHPMLTQGTFFAAAAAAADVLIHRQIIWVKPSLLFGFGDYHWRHELCFYGWRRGFRPPFKGDRNQTTVWELKHDTANGQRQHPTQKPVELFVRPITNHCEPGDAVYEPFSGSGSQIIAAEQCGVSCRAIELNPQFVHVAIDRWEAFTGQKAQKVN